MKNDTEVSKLHHNAFDMLYRLNNMAMQQLKINIMSARKCLIAFLCLFLNLPVYSQETGKVDNSLYMVKSEESLSDSVGKKQKNIFQKVLSYFDDSNKPKTYKKFDFSIIGGPHYSTDTKLGLGLVAAGLYRTNMSDTIMPFSNVSLFGDVTTVGFYLLGIRGNHLFPNDKYRLDYTLYFFSFPSGYWGIGYDMGNDGSNCTKMKRWQAQIKGSFLVKLSKSLYMGPMLAYDFVSVKKVENPILLDGMSLRTSSFGAGFSLVYDSRDVLTCPTKGYYVNVSQSFRPKFIGNKQAFHTTDIRFCGYNKVWKGGVLAYEARGIFNLGETPWSMMATLGNSYSMRGYYEGRYRDKHKLDTQIELRQHVWRRNGIALWAGAGTVFSRFSSIHMDRILPNFGIGYRWEFKKDVNVRLDYGFGKNGQKGFIFNINEAF